MTAPGNGAWKYLAIAFLSALLSGAALFVPFTSRLAVQETRTQTLEQRLDRFEGKLDQALDLLRRRHP